MKAPAWLKRIALQFRCANTHPVIGADFCRDDDRPVPASLRRGRFGFERTADGMRATLPAFGNATVLRPEFTKPRSEMPKFADEWIAKWEQES